MKPLEKLPKEELDRIRLVCFDCDGVTVPEGTRISEKEGRLTVETKQISPELAGKINRLQERFWVVFSSGRSLLYLSRMYEAVFGRKVILQGENGLFTLMEGEVLQLEKLEHSQLETLRRIKLKIRRLAQDNDSVLGFEPKQFLVTVHCSRQIEQIPAFVEEEKGEEEFYVLWSGEAYDINVAYLNKGRGLQKLAARLHLKADEVMAIGNDPNDRQMVTWAGVGITSNRRTMPSARYYTQGLQEAGGEELVDWLLAVYGL